MSCQIGSFDQNPDPSTRARGAGSVFTDAGLVALRLGPFDAHVVRVILTGR